MHVCKIADRHLTKGAVSGCLLIEYVDIELPLGLVVSDVLPLEDCAKGHFRFFEVPPNLCAFF